MSPFLDVENNSTSYKPNATNANISSALHSRIDVAFSLIGGFELFWSIPFFAYYFVRPLRKYILSGASIGSYKQVFSLKTCSEGMPCLCATLIILMSLGYVTLAGIDGPLTVFIFAYAMDSDLGFSTDEAALLNVSFKASGVLGLFIIALLSRFLRNTKITGLCLLVMCVVFTGCLVFIGSTGKVLFWVFICLTSMAYLPLYSFNMAWFGQHITPSSAILSLFVVCFSLSMSFFIWITGSLYEDYTPDAMLYVVACNSVIMLLIMVIFSVVGSVFTRRQTRKKSTQTLGGYVDGNIKNAIVIISSSRL